jgi:diamine N-acetyltransferase
MTVATTRRSSGPLTSNRVVAAELSQKAIAFYYLFSGFPEILFCHRNFISCYHRRFVGHFRCTAPVACRKIDCPEVFWTMSNGMVEHSLPEFRIRRCDSPADAAEIHRLLCELASHENDLASMTSTVDDLRRDGFERCPPSFYADFAECTTDNGICWKAVGLSLYFTSYSSWKGKRMYLEDLYVEPEWRGRGLGHRLMSQVANTAIALDCRRLQWIVLDWNKGSIEFYKSSGALDLPKCKIMCLEGADLLRYASSGIQ